MIFNPRQHDSIITAADLEVFRTGIAEQANLQREALATLRRQGSPDHTRL